MFTKAYKLSLQDSKCVENFFKNVKGENKIEVQLLDMKDPLDVMRRMYGEVVTIHAPLYPSEDMWCNISKIAQALHEQNEYNTYLQKVAHYLRVFNAGFVVHADISSQQLKQSEGYKDLLNYISQNQIHLHIENVTSEVKDAECAVRYPLELCDLLNSQFDYKVAYPLLDICHFQMSRNAFDSSLTLNLKQAIDAYTSEKFIIHFNNSDGSGDSSTGGKHSFNFSNDLKTLNSLLEYLTPLNPILILETNEDDLLNKPRAIWLNNYIEKYEKEKR